MWPTEFKIRDEHKKMKKEAKAILRDKNDYGGHKYLRGQEQLFITPCTDFIHSFHKKASAHLNIQIRMI